MTCREFEGYVSRFLLADMSLVGSDPASVGVMNLTRVKMSIGRSDQPVGAFDANRLVCGRVSLRAPVQRPGGRSVC